MIDIANFLNESGIQLPVWLLLLSCLAISLAYFWFSTRLKNSITAEYQSKLESEKIKLEAHYNRDLEKLKSELEIAYQTKVRLATVYEELSEYIEQSFGCGTPMTDAESSKKLNTMFAKLALFAPDNVYTTVKNAIIGTTEPVYGEDVKRPIYYAFRQSLMQGNTKFEPEDIVNHFVSKVIPMSPKK